MQNRRLALAAMLGLGAALSGCHTPSGGFSPYTGGSHTYFSYETRPVSVTVVDTRNDQVIFRMDVPPGKQLTLDFVPGEGDDPVYTPDLMRYQVWDIGTTTGRLKNSLTVPAYWARRLDVEYREGIEYMSPPPEEQLRTDQEADRPAWWTPEGGPMPVNDGGVSNYDG